MTNIIDFARKLDERRENSDIPEPQIENDSSKEVTSITDKVQAAVEKARVHTGINSSNAQAEKLDGNTAGEYHIGPDQIKIDAKLIEAGDNDDLAHVITHENYHQRNKHKGDEERINDIDFEEALTETATAQDTGKVLAYKEIIHKVDQVASATGETKAKIIDLFKKGENAELNNLHDQTFNKAA